jgi:hypothetical protein
VISMAYVWRKYHIRQPLRYVHQERSPRRNGKTDASGLRKTPMLPVGHIILLNIITVGPTAPIENLPSAITPSMMPSELPALQQPAMPRQRLCSMVRFLRRRACSQGQALTVGALQKPLLH